MDRKEADAIVKKLKEGARANPWVPVGVVTPPERYHHLPELSLCFTLDILPWGRFWHLSIAHRGTAPTPEEVAFWRRAFFDEAPIWEMPGVIKTVNSLHFFWNEASQQGEAIEQESYTCPKCEMTSYHPDDVKHEYCGNCHKTKRELEMEDHLKEGKSGSS